MKLICGEMGSFHRRLWGHRDFNLPTYRRKKIDAFQPTTEDAPTIRLLLAAASAVIDTLYSFRETQFVQVNSGS